MKRILLLLSVGLAACSSVKDKLQSGDLIFVGLPIDYSIDADSTMASAIAASTGSGELNLIHVAIADVEKDGVYIIDATLRHGVDRHPLDTFFTDFTLQDGSLPTFIVKRLKDPKTAVDVIQKAESFCGEPYDTAFREGNNARYCSELVRDSYLTADGGYLFPQEPMNWKDADGEIPVYWTWLFGQIGMEVPQGEPGTNPQGIADSPLLKTIDVQLTDYR